ncbi:MAG: hypothetical protein K6F50_01940 [Kiritimatiellae bacterium]|nr:hypothetical protein [Kiritimatiellia bacterium]
MTATMTRGYVKMAVACAVLAWALTAHSGWIGSMWHVSRSADEPDVSIVNTVKPTFRVYAFNPESGALKHIKFNVREPEKFYVNGESAFTLSLGGREVKAEFVSFDAADDDALCHASERNDDDVLATAKSVFRVPDEDVVVEILYRFRRDSEVMVDCSVVGKKQLPPGSRLAVSYPLSGDYATVGKYGASGDEVHGMALSRKCDGGHRTLIFFARTRDGRGVRTTGLLDAIFSLGRQKGMMKADLSRRDNPLSPAHDQWLTLSGELKDPVTTEDGLLRYSFNFSIPLNL